MDIATYRLRNKRTKQEFSVNKTDYHAALSDYTDCERIGETHGAFDAPLNINTGEETDTSVVALLAASKFAEGVDIDLGYGKAISLPDLVKVAHLDSALSAEDWNELSDEAREGHLRAKAYALRDAATEADKQRQATEDAAAAAEAEKLKGAGGTGPDDGKTDAPSPFDAMNKGDLKAHAKQHFNVDLDTALSKADMLTEVKRLTAEAAAAAQQ